MNKTIVKILTAALAAAMMIGAAGCGSKNTNTNTQSSAQTEGSVVSAAESTEASESESKVSEDTKEESRQGIDLNTLTEDKIRSIVKGTFPENNNAEYVISIIDDGSEYGYAVVSMAREENGKTGYDTLEGVITKYEVIQNDDGTKTEDIVLPSGGAEPVEMYFTTSADGKKTTMNVGGLPFEMEVSPVDKTEGLEKLKEISANSDNMAAKAAKYTAMSDAATIDNCCKNYFAAVISGTLTNGGADGAEFVKSDKLPEKDASTEERKAAALRCTIQGALEYAGIDPTAFNWSKFGATFNGTIAAKEDENQSIVIEKIRPEMTLRELYGDDASEDSGDVSVSDESKQTENTSGSAIVSDSGDDIDQGEGEN